MTAFQTNEDPHALPSENDPLLPTPTPHGSRLPPHVERGLGPDESMSSLRFHPDDVSTSNSSLRFESSVLDVITEGVELMVENVQRVSTDIRQSVAGELKDVTQAFLDEMYESDCGDNFFLEMSLSRNLSITPSDVMNVAQTNFASAVAPQAEQEQALIDPPEDGDEEQEVDALLKTTPQHIPISAYVLLASAVIALSSIGPVLNLQQGCTPVMKIYWRMSATSILLFPFALSSVWQHGFPRLSFPQWTTLILCSAAYTSMGVGFVQSLQYTSVGNATILGNSQAIILLIAKFCVGSPVSFIEATGAVTAFVGACLCSKDSSESDDAGGGRHELKGDLLAFGAGAGGTLYLVLAKSTRSILGLYPFMFVVMSVGSVLALLFQVFVLREHVLLSRDENFGIGGWLNLDADRFPLEVFMVVVCNVLGAIGYVRAMVYFDNLVISVAALMEPVVAEFTAFFLGVGILPGYKGWIGNVLVAVGTIAVIAPSSINGRKMGSSRRRSLTRHSLSARVKRSEFSTGPNDSTANVKSDIASQVDR